jgi:hypothetical protein
MHKTRDGFVLLLLLLRFLLTVAAAADDCLENPAAAVALVLSLQIRSCNNVC